MLPQSLNQQVLDPLVFIQFPVLASDRVHGNPVSLDGYTAAKAKRQ